MYLPIAPPNKAGFLGAKPSKMTAKNKKRIQDAIIALEDAKGWCIDLMDDDIVPQMSLPIPVVDELISALENHIQ